MLETGNRSLRSYVAIAAAVFVICLFDFRVFRYLHLEHLDSLLDIPEQIVRGTPHWRAFQNRVLLPYAIFGASTLLDISFRVTTLLSYGVLCFLGNLVVFAFLRSLQPARNTWEVMRDLVVFDFVVLGLSHNWFYPWDFGEIVLPAVFLMLVRSHHVSLVKLSFLFLVWILNRETGVLIGVWLIIDAILEQERRWKKLAVGLVMVACGLAIVYTLRTTLFRESSLPGVGADLDSRTLGGNHFALLTNLRSIRHQDLFSKEAVNILILACLVPFAYVFRQGIRAHLSVFALMCLLFVSDISFGLMHETRMYYHFVPFLFYFAYAAPTTGSSTNGVGTKDQG